MTKAMWSPLGCKPGGSSQCFPAPGLDRVLVPPGGEREGAAGD